MMQNFEIFIKKPVLHLLSSPLGSWTHCTDQSHGHKHKCLDIGNSGYTHFQSIQMNTL